jgi:hypothetical protein
MDTPFLEPLIPQAGTQQWRPKVTPYRSLVLLSTIVLGSGKAFATARGLSLVATNIEWITSVIIFSVLGSIFKLRFKFVL